MIISHSKQKTFWKIPRTGSSNVEMVLRLTAGLDVAQDVIAETHFFPSAYNFDTMPPRPDGLPGRRRAHITPQTAIDQGFITLAQYNTYENFCIVRDPVDKFISLHSLAFPKRQFNTNIQNIFDELVIPNPTDAIFRPQTAWLTLGNMTTLPFSDYANSVNTILTAFGAPIPDTLPQVRRMNESVENFNRAIATSADRAVIETYYADDMGLNT